MVEKLTLSSLNLKMSTKSIIAEVNKKAAEFIADRRNSNNAIDVISFCQHGKTPVVLAAIEGLQNIFTTAISSAQLKRNLSNDDSSKLPPEEQYKIWLNGCYTDAKKQLLSMCSTGEPKIQLILIALLSHTRVNDELITLYRTYLEYADVLFNTMELVTSILNKETKKNDVFLHNVYHLIQDLTLPKTLKEDRSKSGKAFLTFKPENGEAKSCRADEHKKCFSTLYLTFLSQKLSASLYKKVLISIHDKIMPRMANPLLLADFLTESYNIGGAISLLALNGLFILINNYNLDYPDFYGKLYQLLEPSVFHVKYSARFFHLLNLFLSSTHLPGYLVAAFIKRLARLGLTAPPAALTIVVPFIYNLTRRHPSCSVLIHRAETTDGFASDPFIMTENDPSKCRALESSLWELQTLQSHYYYIVSIDSRQLEQVLPKLETDLSDILETSIDDLVKKENSKKYKLNSVPVTFDPPKGLFGAKDCPFNDMWSL
ncbi:hypothetical protein CAPTEDRAFT_227825 [Capitella teleta]|uniref:CCAAT-binding factor domain-containing protein n=1 Tax=Capitella teleta TaxID=283909 RepID=R7V8S0_CAPTE|nr:hypothetical protein CAPTEDRAFT_227825 [Capitella teleta]|eukprot:ELU14912.1 hypothetical protein CAPTEDRAFT_227825 [Capitella teleta]